MSVSNIMFQSTQTVAHIVKETAKSEKKTKKYASPFNLHFPLSCGGSSPKLKSSPQLMTQ